MSHYDLTDTQKFCQKLGKKSPFDKSAKKLYIPVSPMPKLHKAFFDVLFRSKLDSSYIEVIEVVAV